MAKAPDGRNSKSQRPPARFTSGNLVPWPSQPINPTDPKDNMANLLRDVFVPPCKPVEIRVDDRVAGLILRALASLEYREAECLRLRYGLRGPVRTIEVIGKMIGQEKNPGIPISAQQVSRLIAQALRKLRHPGLSEVIRKAMEKPSAS